jgi:ABC-type polysaccharide/polyol phosphate transport system ATPase subunit
MSDIIRFDRVSKLYSRLEGSKFLSNWGFWRDRSRTNSKRWFRALDNVDFALTKPGRIGIIGSNGSGKTTMLRIIAGVTMPTNGSVVVNGRVVPLLEVFSGMQPDLTGRENIYFSGIMLGMRRREIQRKFDAIVEFAGIEEFLDMQIKHYSLGMVMRLGFSVSIHVDAQIILVDEVWSIGDAEFQGKSFERLEALQKQGTTQILVTHDLKMLRELADEVLWLSHGRVVARGPAAQLIDTYLKESREHSAAPGKK